MTCISSIAERPLHSFQLSLLSSILIAITACSSDSGSSPDATGSTSPTAGAQSETANDDASGPGTIPTDEPVRSQSTLIGEVFVSAGDDLTLYTFANDEPGVSNCHDGCAADWPPALAAESAETGDFNTITRRDQSLQWAFKGSPLYRYAGDGAAGETSGEGLGGVWFVARPDPIATATTALGTVLAGRGRVSAGSDDPAQRLDFDGRTLYVFANDAPGISNCNGGCATNWPPLLADKGATGSGEYSLVARDDGTSQWAYRTQPLYFYAADSEPGETLGEGVGGTWTVARP